VEIVASWPSRSDLADAAGWARRAEGLGVDVVHVPETVHDPFTVAALMLAGTDRVVVRTSMAVAFARSPMLTAYSAWGLQKLSQGRFQLGVASQVRGNIVGRFSAEWSEPVARLTDYVRSLRAIFHAFQSGEDLAYTGPHYAFDRLQPYFDPGPLDHPAPPIWTGGVNARMVALAAEVADGFVCHPTTSHPDVMRADVLPVLGGGPLVVAGPQPLMAATSDALASVRAGRRSELGFLYSTPAYRRQLAHFGLAELGETLSGLAARRDWGDLARHLTDEVLERLVPQGTYEEIPDVLGRWYAGLCHGLVLTLPEAPDDDDAIRAMVGRCRDIPAAIPGTLSP
jgi:probable F420-dependent oxidoreductase